MIIKKEGLNSGTFADEIGVQRSSISHILNGRNNPSLDFVTKTLKRFPGINPEWLIMGEGAMYRETAKAEIPEEKSNNSHDLFSSIENESLERNNEPDDFYVDEEIENEEVIKKPGSKYVSQILVFYSDSTYEAFKPEKPG